MRGWGPESVFCAARQDGLTPFGAERRPPKCSGINH